jgi:hypothetical protein
VRDRSAVAYRSVGLSRTSALLQGSGCVLSFATQHRRVTSVGAHPVRDCHAWVYRFVGLSRTRCAPTNGRTATLTHHSSACAPFVGAHLCATAALWCSAPSVCRAQVRSYKGAAQVISSAMQRRAKSPFGSAPSARLPRQGVSLRRLVAHRVRTHRLALRASVLSLGAWPCPHATSERSLAPNT